MLKEIHPLVDIFRNDEFLPIPRCSFICKFQEPYINQQNQRIMPVQAVSFNKNLFNPYEHLDLRLDSINTILYIIFVFPGENFNHGKFVLKKGSNHLVCMMSVKALGTYNIQLYKQNSIFIFIGFHK